MAKLLLARQPELAPPNEADREAARRVLFAYVDGLGDMDRRRWRRFWKTLINLEPGEVLEVSTKQPRIGWYHRKHMALEQAIFRAQDVFPVFPQFRDWLKLGAGHCQWLPHPDGGSYPAPKTIQYTDMEQGEMEEFHHNVVTFLRGDRAGPFLWPHLPLHKSHEMIEVLLQGFNE